MLYNFLQM